MFYLAIVLHIWHEGSGEDHKLYPLPKQSYLFMFRYKAMSVLRPFAIWLDNKKLQPLFFIYNLNNATKTFRGSQTCWACLLKIRYFAKEFAFHYLTSRKHAAKKTVHRCIVTLKKNTSIWISTWTWRSLLHQNETSLKHFPIFWTTFLIYS